MSSLSVRGHDRVAHSLARARRDGRLPHALFFAGPEGVGKRTFARALAQSLLCERGADRELGGCGACPGCVQVTGGTHPDLLEAARPDDKHELPIQVIRDLCDWFALKPARGQMRKVAILDDADDLNDEASNAFLKTLEEPPPGRGLDPDRDLARASVGNDRIAVPGDPIRPAAGGRRRGDSP